MRDKFWQRFPMEELTHEEWEALCDGCGRCCLIKLEDADAGDLYYTSVSCQYLCGESVRCTAYSERSVVMPSCVPVTPHIARQSWLPATCAYRLVAEGKELAHWHPLVSGRQDSVREAGISVKGLVISELDVAEEDQQDYIVHWVSADGESIT